MTALLYTVAEVADILKMNDRTIRNWIAAGTIPAIRVGSRVRIRAEDVEALLTAPETAL